VNKTETRALLKEAGHLIMDGLSSEKTYVVLQHAKRAGIHLAIRPFVYKQSENTAFVGGKLRVAFDATYEGGMEMDEEGVVDNEQKLRDAYPKLDWHNSDYRRLSTTVGVIVGCPSGMSGTHLLELVSAEELADKLMEWVEKWSKAAVAEKRKTKKLLTLKITEEAVERIYGADAYTPNRAQQKLAGKVSKVFAKGEYVEYADEVEAKLDA
jgi:uncharacterized protein YgiM (DUF1202 family)